METIELTRRSINGRTHVGDSYHPSNRLPYSTSLLNVLWYCCVLPYVQLLEVDPEMCSRLT